MATKTKLIKKGVKKLKEVQDDLFPDTLPKSKDTIKKATKEQQDKLKRDQMDMFPEDLAKRQKDAQMKKDMLGKKKRKKKAVKKAAGGPIEEFGAGGKIAKGVVKGIKKTKEYLKKRKKRKSFKKPDYSETKVINRTDSKDFDPGGNKRPLLPKQKEMQQKLDKLEGKDYKAGGGKVERYAGGGRIKTERERAQQIVDEGYAKVKARREKAKRIAKGDMNPKKYASGGRVKKSIDGIAQRGLTRAKHK